ncbi:MAG: hypothetical protein A2091_11525 [Desulfuromonadales bacterium GWD2_61_12]|nr:MAG: hypothetical protein A2005_07925 [Desulfuromonadales bacterium GWC2_61_20]OGR36384.1 MAG: hypothetical protein A2091_11525 [Desulfuromonadales bacterium GWD2_61_12]HAD03730.1 DUF507 domain-containing protein [Desulfuromonas sp.]
MKISDERISHLSHILLDELWRGDLVDCPDEGRALDVAKASLARFFSVDDEVDALVRGMLTRQQKIVGSREWQILYDKYFRAEMEKRRW